MSLPRPSSLSEAVLVTHQECCDGAGCAVLFVAAGGKPENVRYVPAGGVERWTKKDPRGDVASGRFLVFADLGTASSRLADELEKRGEVVLLDHHKTSLGLSGRSWCDVRMDACGTELLRQYLSDRLGSHDKRGQWHDQSAWEYFAQLIDDRDRWQLKLMPLSKQLVDLMNFVGQEEFVRLMGDWPGRNMFFVDGPFTDAELFALRTIERRTDENVRNILRRTVTVEQSWGKTGYVVSSEWQTSELLHEMLERDPSLKAACQINFDKNIVSLRGRIDVSEVAQAFGGGGHAAAAGHRLPDDLVIETIGRIH